MDYFKYDITVEVSKREIVLAFLSQLSFDTFEESATGINAFIPANLVNDELENALSGLSQQYSFEWKKEFIPYKNWNAVWESNFEPIQVGNFCGIRADFHPPFAQVAHEIVINPKMAFGTGHHATTFMMLEMMEKEDFTNKKVLDYGCGTGILAIMAAFLGANDIDAVDIEEPAYENTLENIQINKTPNIKVYCGTLDRITATHYDCILANINRNVILDSLFALYEKVKTGGSLFVSGFLKKDEPLLKTKAQQQGFTISSQLEKADWVCIKFLKN